MHNSRSGSELEVIRDSRQDGSGPTHFAPAPTRSNHRHPQPRGDVEPAAGTAAAAAETAATTAATEPVNPAAEPANPTDPAAEPADPAAVHSGSAAGVGWCLQAGN